MTISFGSPANLGVLISGSGRSLENLSEVIAGQEVDARIACVISSRKDAFGLQRAERLGIPQMALRPRDFRKPKENAPDADATVPDALAYSNAVFAELRSHKVEIVCLLGFLSLLLVPEDYEGRVVNIHPALLPDFGGKGMYGHHVHEAVIAQGRSESGCTVHYCDNEYDNGQVILQRRCPVLPGDDADALAARVFEEEKLAFPQALRKILGASS